MTQANDIVYADIASRTKHLTEQIELHRIVELVHDADLPNIAAQQRATLRRRIAALTSAFRGGNPIVFGWTRHTAAEQIAGEEFSPGFGSPARRVGCHDV